MLKEVSNEMKKTFFRLMGAAIVAGLAFAATSMGQATRIAITIVVGLPSFVLMTISRRQLGESFAVAPKAKALVTTGLYSKIQHPMYVFLDLFLMCIVVAIDSQTLILAWALVVVLQAIQAHREEKILSTAFGAEYKAYEARTWI
jgi:protein-S-isoprenylcysteine O-methyltransferase Ste14